MLLAIVGSLSLGSHPEAVCIIRQSIRRWQPWGLVSGGAKGIDSLAAHLARTEFFLPVVEALPAYRGWKYYKARDLLIAYIGTRLVRIVDCQATTYGSGWTRDRAEDMGKETEEFVIHTMKVCPSSHREPNFTPRPLRNR